MAKGYWIGRVDIGDPERYKDYVAANGAAFAKHGARFIVRGGTFRIGEGEARQRNVVIEFPTYEAALACWDDPLYQAAREKRLGASVADIIIIEGHDG